MRWNRVLLSMAMSSMMALAASAQGPAPAGIPAPPAPRAGDAPPPRPFPVVVQTGTPASYDSRVRTVIYGLRGEGQALVLRNGVAVTLPPDLAARTAGAISRGTRVRVSGTRQVIAGETTLAAQNVLVSGQTYAAQAAPALPGAPAGGVAVPPPPPPARGVLRGPAGAPGARAGGVPPPPPPLPPATSAAAPSLDGAPPTTPAPGDGAVSTPQQPHS